MRKVLLIILGIVAGIILLCSLGNLIGLAISAAIIFAGIHFYLKAQSGFVKFMWIVVGIIGGISAISNIPGFIGLLALAAIYWAYKKWDSSKPVFTKKSVSDDPFTNFEKQWNDLQK